MLQLEIDMNSLESPFLKKALQLITDGYEPGFVKSILMETSKKELQIINRRNNAIIEMTLAIQAGSHPEVIKEKADAIM